jgi:chromosome segregation ATPase
MTSEINELFEQSVTHSQQLTDTADGVMNAVDAMTKNAESLTARVQEEAHVAAQHLRDLVARLEHAEGELEGSRGHAESALEGLAAKAADVKAEVGNLLERVKKGMADLETQKGRLDESLEGQVSTTRSDFTELAQKTHEAEAEAGRHLDEAGAVLSAFRSAIDAGRNEFAHKRDAWEAALDSLETHANEAADAWARGLHGLLSTQASTMVETANHLVDRHNEAMAGLKHRFVEQAPQELTSALEPLRAAIETLKEGVATREQSLSSHAQDLGQAANDAVSVIETVRAGLSATARLG